MPKGIRVEVYKRIVLAKALYEAGRAACTIRNDQMIFTKGILLLHDAVEAALGAVADYVNAKLTGNHYLMDYYDLIEKADAQKRRVPYRTQMRNLNTVRNNAKHQGIFPDPKNSAHFSPTVYALIEEVCEIYLGLDFSYISLKSLIKNKKILGYIDQAEKEIKKRKIEKGLISLAYAMYYTCEASTIPWPFSYLYTQKGKETSLQFTQPYKIEHAVKLIEHGVDPFLYYRFKNLTPKIARSRETGKLFYWWDKHYGHSANWTVRNSHFCLNFCIETALKFQRDEDEGYTLIPYTEVFEDIIKPIKDEVTIWNQSFYPSDFLIQKSSKPRSAVLILKKNQSIVGWATDSENKLDEWFIISKDIPSKSGEGEGFGFVMKSDVKITQRKKQTFKEINNSEIEQ